MSKYMRVRKIFTFPKITISALTDTAVPDLSFQTSLFVCFYSERARQTGDSPDHGFRNQIICGRAPLAFE